LIVINYFNDIFDKAVSVLSKSNDIKVWVDAHNPPATKLFIYDGVLKETLPKSDSYPIVAFSNVAGLNRGDEIKDNEFLLDVTVAIYNDKKTSDKTYEETIIPADPPKTVETIVRKYPGKQSVNDLWLIVSKEILSIKGLSAKISSEGQTDYEEVYPIFKFAGAFRFAFHRSMRNGSRF